MLVVQCIQMKNKNMMLKTQAKNLIKSKWTLLVGMTDKKYSMKKSLKRKSKKLNDRYIICSFNKHSK
jgi:hypothetical protein